MFWRRRYSSIRKQRGNMTVEKPRRVTPKTKTTRTCKMEHWQVGNGGGGRESDGDRHSGRSSQAKAVRKEAVRQFAFFERKQWNFNFWNILFTKLRQWKAVWLLEWTSKQFLFTCQICIFQRTQIAWWLTQCLQHNSELEHSNTSHLHPNYCVDQNCVGRWVILTSPGKVQSYIFLRMNKHKWIHHE